MRFDAWVTPPAYTGRAPLMLADGSHSVGAANAESSNQVHEVPDRSVLIIRASGPGAGRLALEVTSEGKAPEKIEAKPPQQDLAPTSVPGQSEIAEIRSICARQERGRERRVRHQALAVQDHSRSSAQDRADQGPRAHAARRAEAQLQDRGRLRCGVRGRAHHARDGREPEDPARSWAKPEAKKGPRPPLERPPVLALRLPRASAKQAEAASYHELAGHPGPACACA